MTSDVATGFNQRKPPHRTICVAVDLTAAFDKSTITYCYQILQIQRFLRQTADGSRTTSEADNQLCCRGVKSKVRIIHTGVPQGSKLSPTLFSFYIADITSVGFRSKKISELAIDISTKVISNLVYANTRLKIKIADSEFSLVRNPNILGVYLDTFL